MYFERIAEEISFYDSDGWTKDWLVKHKETKALSIGLLSAYLYGWADIWLGGWASRQDPGSILQLPEAQASPGELRAERSIVNPFVQEVPPAGPRSPRFTVYLCVPKQGPLALAKD